MYIRADIEQPDVRHRAVKCQTMPRHFPRDYSVYSYICSHGSKCGAW